MSLRPRAERLPREPARAPEARDARAQRSLLILQGYHPGQIAYGTGGPGKAENLYTEELLRESFAALEILHLRTHDDVVDEGPGHRGMSALIDLVARRPS